MEQCKIDRINELTRISRERCLTPEETEERKKLREEYVSAFRDSLKAQLDCIRYVDENGNPIKPEK